MGLNWEEEMKNTTPGITPLINGLNLMLQEQRILRNLSSTGHFIPLQQESPTHFPAYKKYSIIIYYSQSKTISHRICACEKTERILYPLDDKIVWEDLYTTLSKEILNTLLTRPELFEQIITDNISETHVSNSE